ncbi:hypothetical protein IFM89_000904 [Coptis chinensis]|uniref:Uncharacterized protein n=1 Tax=Coptis chinensis TaxID=261450 RepID=A0A835IJE2_9MAGN|nr:hypothetical protein IFM89_000904 [Coptis chinensis]
MAFGTTGRSLMGPLLAINFVIYLIVLGLAGWSLDKYINGQQHHPHLGGNPATIYMLIFTLIGGVIGALSVLAGLMHFRSWRNDSLASAASSAIVAFAITALAFGLACKEITMGGHRGRRLQTLEAFVIISTLTQLMYLILLHSGMYSRRYGPGYRNSGTEYGGPGYRNPGIEYGAMGHEPQKTSTPPPPDV